jgi:hypothetical protein
MQAERQRQPADAAAGNEYGHDCALVTDGVMAWQGNVGNYETGPL